MAGLDDYVIEVGGQRRESAWSVSYRECMCVGNLTGVHK